MRRRNRTMLPKGARNTIKRELYSVTYEQGDETQTACWDVPYTDAKRWYDSLRQLSNAKNLQMTKREVTSIYGEASVVHRTEGQ